MGASNEHGSHLMGPACTTSPSPPHTHTGYGAAAGGPRPAGMIQELSFFPTPKSQASPSHGVVKHEPSGATVPTSTSHCSPFLLQGALPPLPRGRSLAAHTKQHSTLPPCPAAWGATFPGAPGPGRTLPPGLQEDDSRRGDPRPGSSNFSRAGPPFPAAGTHLQAWV